MKRTAKRTTANEIASHPVFPKEILDLISKCVWEQSTTLGSFLNWHSTWYFNFVLFLHTYLSSKYYWNQYLNLDEEKLLSFAEEKRRKNEELLKKHFRVEYRDNILGK